MVAQRKPSQRPENSQEIDAEQQKPGKIVNPFIQAEKLIVYDKEVSPLACRAYFIYADYARQDGTCFPSMTTMAAHLNCCTRTVIRLNEELANRGYLQRIRHGRNQTNSYRLLLRVESAQEKQTELTSVSDTHPDDVANLSRGTDIGVSKDVTLMSVSDVTSVSPNVYAVEVHSDEKDSVNVAAQGKNSCDPWLEKEITDLCKSLKDPKPDLMQRHIIKLYSNLLEKWGAKMQNGDFAGLMHDIENKAKADTVDNPPRFFWKTFASACDAYTPLVYAPAPETPQPTARELDPLGNGEQNRKNIERLLARQKE